MPTSDPKHYLPVLQKSLWFNGLPPAAAQDLLSEATVLHLGAGQQLFLRGDSFDGIYCVMEGGLRLTGIAPNGQENLFSVISPPPGSERSPTLMACHARTMRRPWGPPCCCVSPRPA